MEGTIIMNLSLGTNVALVTLFHISSHAPGRGGTSCSNTLRRHCSLPSQRFCAVSERESKTVRRLAVVPFLARPKPKIPFLGLSFLQNQTETLATQTSDTWLRVYWKIFVKIFVSATEFRRRNNSHKFRLIWLFAAYYCNKILLRRQRFCGKGRNTSSPKNACVGGYVLLIPLELIRNNFDRLCQKGTRASPHRQSYDIRTPWYK